MTEQQNVLPASAPNYKRSARNIFIHKPMQREFSFVLITLFMVSTLVIGYVIHHTLQNAIANSYQFGRISPYELLSDISYDLIVRVSSVLFVTLLIVGLFGVLFLHRVAGPVYRFRQTFIKLANGSVPPLIKLREGDFFAETADEINRLLERLNSEKDKGDFINQKLDQILSSNPPEPIAQLARDAKTRVRELIGMK